MVAIPLASKSDPAKREVVTSETLVNMYASKSPSGARSEFYLTRTPGLTAWSRNSSDICRGLFDADEYALGVFGSTLFRFNSSGGATSISGSISGTRDVRWSQNNASNRETAIVTGGTAYQYDGSTLTTISDGDLPSNPIDTVCINGITLMLYANRKVYFSPVNDANSYGAADFFTVPGTGELKAGMVIGGQIVFWGQDDFYIFRHVAEDADDPFQLVQGASKPFGSVNTFSNCNVSGAVFFVDQEGMPRMFGQGYLPEAIGSEGTQADMDALADKSEVRMWGYNAGDRAFVVLWSTEFCWVYDLKERRWHNRQSYQRTTWQAKYYVRFAEKDLVAPDQSGGVFYLDDTTLTEDGEHLVWEVTCPPVTNFPNGGTLHTLDLDIEVGTALGGSAADEDQLPAITMFKSIDGGKTFATGRQASLGSRGQWRKRVSWNRCGAFGREGVVLRFSGSAGVPHAILLLAANIKERAA
jgi:hypothetical protein